MTEKEWKVIEFGDLLEDALNRQHWERHGYEVFQILSAPDRIVLVRDKSWAQKKEEPK